MRSAIPCCDRRRWREPPSRVAPATHKSRASPLAARRSRRDGPRLSSGSSIKLTAFRAAGECRSRERHMTVKAILATKGGDVISIEPTATLDAAVKKLAEHKIGALLVFGPDRRVIGILSERDIVRVVAQQGAGALAQPLSQVMTRKVVTCSPSETIGVIME